MVSRVAFAEARRGAERLARRTSMRVGGRPRYLFEPEDAREAGDLVRRCRRDGLRVRVLGGGSNVVAGDAPLDAAVLATRRMRGLEATAETVRVASGVSLPGLVRRAADLGIPVLSGLSGIPGTVGGAVAMNAGGRPGTVADALRAVEGIDATGEPFRVEVTPAAFGYRRSPFGDAVITAAVFRREPDLDAAAERARRLEVLAAKQRVQPLGARSSGCIFKNPPAGPSAGRLIDVAGLKGRAVGDAQVSLRHGNFIVNRGRATGRDVRTLIDLVRAAVRRRFGVELELEVRLWS